MIMAIELDVIAPTNDMISSNFCTIDANISMCYTQVLNNDSISYQSIRLSWNELTGKQN